MGIRTTKRTAFCNSITFIKGKHVSFALNALSNNLQNRVDFPFLILKKGASWKWARNKSTHDTIIHRNQGTLHINSCQKPIINSQSWAISTSWCFNVKSPVKLIHSVNHLHMLALEVWNFICKHSTGIHRAWQLASFSYDTIGQTYSVIILKEYNAFCQVSFI